MVAPQIGVKYACGGGLCLCTGDADCLNLLLSGNCKPGSFKGSSGGGVCSTL